MQHFHDRSPFGFVEARLLVTEGLKRHAQAALNERLPGDGMSLCLCLRICSRPKSTSQPAIPSRLDRIRRLDGNVEAPAQTPDGYLWIGSTEGLFRFDGL
jgi:hypothetical protein